MNQPLDIKRTLQVGFAVFLIGFVMSLIVMPKEFFAYQNADKGLSPVGLAISKSYYHYPELVSPINQGYINNGQYHYYRNWPPSGFLILSSWFELNGNDSISTARFFSSIIYALTGLLLFIFLKINEVNNHVTLLSTIVFLSLPINLESSTYIYADIWVNFFWLLGLVSFSVSKKWPWSLLSIICLIGFTFHWFIIFLLPSVIIVKYLSVRRGQVLLISGSLFLLIIYLVLEYLPYEYSQTQIINALRRHSTIGFFDQFTELSSQIPKKTAYFLFQFFVILFLVIVIRKNNNFSFARITNQKLIPPFKHLVITLFLIGCFFLKWVFVHRHFLIFTSIPLAIIVAICLQSEFEKSLKTMYRTGSIAIAICILQYITMTEVLKKRHGKIEQQDFNISEFILNNHKEKNPPFVVFDIYIKSFDNKDLIRKYAIREFTNSYILDLHTIGERSELKNALLNGNNKLREIKPINYTGQLGYFVTNLELDAKYEFVTDHAEFNNVFIYRVDLSSILR